MKQRLRALGTNPMSKEIQEKMVLHFGACDAEFGGRVAAGIGIAELQAARS